MQISSESEQIVPDLELIVFEFNLISTIRSLKDILCPNGRKKPCTFEIRMRLLQYATTKQN